MIKIQNSQGKTEDQYLNYVQKFKKYNIPENGSGLLELEYNYM